MKKNLLVIISMLLCMIGYAQEEEPIQTIFDGKIHHISGFGGPFMSFTTFDNQFAHMMGGGGGVLLNHKAFFGGYGYSMTTPIDAEPQMQLNFGNGGFWFGYIVKYAKPIHASLHLQTGWGEVRLEDADYVVDYDKVFVMTPAAEIELNMTKFFKMGVGANYRLVVGASEWLGYSNTDFSSPGVFLSFKFGWF